MRYAFACLALGLMVAGFAGFSFAEEAKEFSAKCVVSGAAAKEEHSVEFEGKKVYFCCPNCPKAFKADEKKFATKAHAQFAATKQIVQVACPLSGGPVDESKTEEVAGVKVGFCCEKCQGKVAAATGDDKVALVFAKLDKGFTSQTKCPVSGKAIDASKSVEYKGKKVYFCCGNCPAAFETDPAKFEAKLPQLKEEAK